MRERQLVADAEQRLIETEPGFDADDEQVERVGQREPDAVLRRLRQPRKHHARQDVPEQAAHEREHEARTSSGAASRTAGTRRWRC